MQRFLAVACVVLLCASQAYATERRLNVLFIAVDDLRPELGCYGQPQMKSSNIDALANRGLLFNRAYCQLALCNPSRASLLSGRRPESLGVYDLKTFVRDDNPDVITLPQHFKNNGYRSLSFGKIFHTTNGNHDDPASWSENPWRPGRDTGLPPRPGPKPGEDIHANELPHGAPDVADDALADGKVAQAAIAAMRQNRDKPLFLAVGFHKPHLPFVAPKKYWDLYDPENIELPPNRSLPKDAPALASNDASELRRYMSVPKKGPIADDEARRLIHGYLACVSYVDAQVGKVLAELDALGLREKTIVILWGDHGYHLGEQGTWNKRTNWEIATRVPMILATPGQDSAGATTNALVEFVDIYPTLVELCGLPMPDKLEGASMTPLLADPRRPWKRAAFSIYQKESDELGHTTGRAMRTDRYRFVEWSGRGSDQRIHELYDHQADPRETRNLANLPENKQLVARLSEQLDAGWKGAAPAK